MHRRNAQSALTYTPQDILLFKDSPFASWMERLTLENPLHGIASDESGETPGIHDSFGGPVDQENFSAHNFDPVYHATIRIGSIQHRAEVAVEIALKIQLTGGV